MRLIDIDAFMEEHKHHWGCLSANDMYWKEQLTNRAPTVDAIEVVRCKDCQHFKSAYYDCIGYFCKPSCGLANGLRVPNEDTFCSYGKKKE